MSTFLVYDGECRLCRVFAWIMTRLAVRDPVTRVSFSEPRASELLQRVPATERYRSFHLVTREGALHSAGAGVAALLTQLPGGLLSHGLMRRAPSIQQVIDWLYGLVAGQKARRACGMLPVACDAREMLTVSTVR